MALTPLRRCSFHVFVRLSRVQSDSPRGLHGNPRKNLSILSLDSSERELFQESLGPFSAPLLSSLNLSRLRPEGGELFSSPTGSCLTTARLSRTRRNKKRKKEKKAEEKRNEEKYGSAPLKEVYFANKTGPVPCLLKQ